MFLSIIMMFFATISCHNMKKTDIEQSLNDSVPQEIVFGVNVTKAHTFEPCTLNVSQMDSMISTDKLPVLNKWTKQTLSDEETKIMNDYMTLYDKTSNIVYTVKKISLKDYVVSKRQLSTTGR